MFFFFLHKLPFVILKMRRSGLRKRRVSLAHGDSQQHQQRTDGALQNLNRKKNVKILNFAKLLRDEVTITKTNLAMTRAQRGTLFFFIRNHRSFDLLRNVFRCDIIIWRTDRVSSLNVLLRV